MNCPNCSKPMRKVGWRITNNGGDSDSYKEYNKTTYNCEPDDIWVTTETPIEK